jgi:hypothetical protein
MTIVMCPVMMVIFYHCDGTNDHHYGTLCICITLVMGHITIITGHCTFDYPCDGTYNHHYGTLCRFITLVMGHMTIIMGHCTFALPLWWDIWPSLWDIVHLHYPCDGTYDHHYGTLYIFITLVMGHMIIITRHCTFSLPLWWDIWPSLWDIVHFITGWGS